MATPTVKGQIAPRWASLKELESASPGGWEPAKSKILGARARSEQTAITTHDELFQRGAMRPHAPHGARNHRELQWHRRERQRGD